MHIRANEEQPFSKSVETNKIDRTNDKEQENKAITTVTRS